MHEAAVGYQCRDCFAEGRRSMRQPRTVYGGSLGRGNAVTYALIAINVALMIVVWATGGQSSELLHWSWQYSGEPLTAGDPVGGVGAGEYWRLLTATFMHDPRMPFHILMNMLALWIFGPQLEQRLGWWRFLVLYLLSALSGSVAVYWLSAPGATVGASGAVFGLLGAALVITVRRGYDASWLIGLLVINAVFSFSAPQISWQGHLGGFVGGALLALLLEHAPRRRRTAWQTAGFAVLLAICVALVVVRTATIDTGVF